MDANNDKLPVNGAEELAKTAAEDISGAADAVSEAVQTASENAAETVTEAAETAKIGAAEAVAEVAKEQPAEPKKKNKVTSAISTVLVVIVVLLAVALVGARLVGLKVYTILSGSMEPTYHTGSLIYVKTVDPLTIEAGTPITFMLDEDTIATHRVVAVIPDEEDAQVVRFQTKGDANESPDGSLVHCRNVIGVPVFTIPYLGYVANYIQHPPGKYIAIAVIVIILLLVFVPDLFDDSKKGKKQKEADSTGTKD